MNEPKEYYQVLQGGHPVGSFLKKKNAEAYVKEFNTKVQISSIEIVVRQFSDYIIEDGSDFESDFDWGAWNEEHDSTSEHGGV